MSGMMIEDLEDWHVRWMKRQIERLEKFRRGGETIQVGIGEYQQLLSELIGCHIHIRRLTETLNAQYRHSQPLMYRVSPDQKKEGGT